jgi:hypothetical protein
VYPHFLACACLLWYSMPYWPPVCLQTGIQTNFQMTNANLGAELASFVAAYGTHYREPARPGGLHPLSAEAEHRRQRCTVAS